MSLLGLHKEHPLESVPHPHMPLLSLITDLENELLTAGAHRRLTEGVYAITQNNNNPDHRIELDYMLVSSFLNTLQEAKNVHYNNSWSKRGLLSMFMNVERKWERVDHQLFNDIGDAGSEAFIDTLGDLAVYATKMFAWYAARSPVAYARWLESVRKEAEAVGQITQPQPKSAEDEPCILRCGCKDYCKGHPLSDEKHDSTM